MTSTDSDITSNTSLSTSLSIAPLTSAQADLWMQAQLETRGEDQFRRLAQLWDETQDGMRAILAAWRGDNFCGHVTLVWQSYYPPFRKHNIPEIVDLWVDERFRRQGIGRQLLEAIDALAATRNPHAIGLGVGVTKSFGAAHVLYHTYGFAPDGSGLWVDGVNVDNGTHAVLDDNAILMMVKRR